MLRRKILALCLCLMTAGAALASPADSLEVKRPKARWRGGAAVEAGSNFHINLLEENTHNLGNISANIGFTRGKFDFDLASKLANEHQITGKIGGNVIIADNDTTLKADASVNEQHVINSESSLNIRWYTGRNLYKAYYKLKTTDDAPYNYNLTSIYIWEDQDDLTYDYSLESGSKNTYRHQTGVNMEHSFSDPDRLLYFGMDMDIYSSAKCSEWSTGSADSGLVDLSVKDYTEESRYRQTPSSRYYDVKLELLYTDRELFNVKDFRGDFGFKIQTRGLTEHMSAATYIGDQWRDSLAVRENFLYTTLSTAPVFHINFKRGIYALDWTYSPEYFSYELDEENHPGNVNEGDVAHLLEINQTLKPWRRHTFKFNCKRTDERPDYLQICWFPRYSSIYANEIYVGNPDLRTSITNNGLLSYEFSTKRFSAGVELSDVFKPRKIEKTYNNETYGDKDYRIYTWINGGQSNECSINLFSKWKGERLTLSLAGKYRYYKGYSASGSETKSSDYSVSGNWSYILRTWKFEGNAAYQSGLNRSYYSVSSVIDGNIKISKTFGKHISVYLYGQNLLDNPLLVETKSEDEKEIRYEKFLTYKRLIKLGVSYKF